MKRSFFGYTFLPFSSLGGSMINCIYESPSSRLRVSVSRLRRPRPAILAALTILLLTATTFAQDIASFEKRITVKTLPNGLTVMVMERPEAPVFSFYTIVDAGSAQDPLGKTGLAHMFEHMAFKGSTNIGTTDYPAEKEALAKLEEAYSEYDRERRNEVGRDDKKLAELDKKWKEIAEEADKYVKDEEFSQLVENNGGVGLNANTTSDQTNYYYSLPSNQLELWAFLESERFFHPVMREFYKERDVVVEERRRSVESSPIGRLVEQILSASYTAHPYQRPTLGWYSDISNVSATDASNFFKTYYTPANTVVAVVGDVKAAEVMPIVEKYFGRIPAAPKPLGLNTVEPKQIAERTVVLREASQPWYIEAYHRPDYRDPDDAVYDAISDLMENGRTSRLHRSLVRDKKVALFAGGQSGFPGSKYPQLYLFYAVPNQGKTPKDLAAAFREEIDKLKTTDVTDEELQMVKTRAKASLIRGLGDNPGLAQQLAETQTRYGDWREIFRYIDRIDKVTKADIRRVANKTFVPSNRTVAMIETERPPAPASAAKGGK
jgi:predicted Zn-dependent peptidase